MSSGALSYYSTVFCICNLFGFPIIKGYPVDLSSVSQDYRYVLNKLDSNSKIKRY